MGLGVGAVVVPGSIVSEMDFCSCVTLDKLVSLSEVQPHKHLIPSCPGPHRCVVSYQVHEALNIEFLIVSVYSET